MEDINPYETEVKEYEARTRTLHITVEYDEEEKDFVAFCPQLPYCEVGQTKEEALRLLVEAAKEDGF